MRMGRTLCCFYWATLYCVMSLAFAAEEDLIDFDFADLKEIDWNYDNEQLNKEPLPPIAVHDKKLTTNVLSFDETDFDESLNQVRPFDWREKVFRTALAKALANAALRQKFVEVMPILRVLSTQQRLALSAVISAQINARKGHELKLDQVRMMFGNDKNLLVPIVYDIANLVQKSARKYINYENDNPQLQQQYPQQLPNVRRMDMLDSAELSADDAAKDVGVQAEQESLEDFFEVHDDILDPQEINEELQADVLTKNSSNSGYAVNVPAKRQRRAAESAGIAAPSSTAFVHKLIRSAPLHVNEDDLYHNKLNTTVFQQPQTPTTTAATITTTNTPDTGATARPAYYDIEDLAFASLNGTTIGLTANASAHQSEDTANATDIEEEPLPTPEELIAGPRYRISGNKMHFLRSKMANRKRVQIRSRPKLPASVVPAPALHNAIEVPAKCERFTSSMCIRTEDYPLDQIMGSIRRHKNAMSALLAEYNDKPDPIDFNEDFEDFPFNKKRREDDGSGGSMCQSIVRYARPQKARSAAGEWKYIVNTGQHTQTLRLEKCTRPMESCSYLAQTYRSHCAQVYNYHRLLSWDKSRGLHVDIYKVPTCCSCQVDGYRQLYPPLDTVKPKDYTPAYQTDSYGAVHEDFEYTDESDEDDLNYAYNNNYKHNKPDAHLDANELFLGSKKVRTKTYPASATVGSFLSPPEHDDYEPKHSYRNRYHGSSAAAKPSASGTLGSSSKRQRRPYKSLSAAGNEARVDLEFAPSETHTDKEVNLIGRTTHVNAKTSAPQKRKRIYSVPHTSAPTFSSNDSTIASTGVGHKQQQQATTYTAPRAGYRGRTTATTTVSTTAAGGVGNIRGTSSTATITNQIRQSPIPHYHQQQYQPSEPSSVTNKFNGHSGDNANGYGAGENGRNKTRPRYYTAIGAFDKANDTTAGFGAPISTTSASATTTARPATTTESNEQLQSTPTAFTPSLYQLNSIFSSKFNSSLASGVDGSHSYSNSLGTLTNTHAGVPKRINYSYHPIIDFFENHKPQYTDHTKHANNNNNNNNNINDNLQNLQINNGNNNNNNSNLKERLYPYTITKSTPAVRDPNQLQYQINKERRIGYGIGGGGGLNGGPLVVQQQSDNPWHPVIVGS